MDFDLQHLLVAWTYSQWLLPVVFLLCVLDGVVPVVPSETAVIAASVAAVGSARSPLLVVVGVAAAGSLVGDHLAYAVGRRLPVGRPGTRRAAAVTRARGLLHRHGGRLMAVGRFVPGGRTAVSLAAGASGMRSRTFSAWAAVTSLAWAVYMTGLGRLAAHLTDNPLVGTLVGVCLAGLVTVALAVRSRMLRLPEVVQQGVHHGGRVR